VNIPYIDIHTHNPVNTEEIISIPSLFLQNIDKGTDLITPFSAAIHPWDATKFSPEQVRIMLKNLENQQKLIAIGETGLDKICTADYQRQKLIFEMHLEFAEQYRKPVILHAVKSWNELIEYIKRANISFVLHGYSAGIELTKQLIDMGCYFSVGKSVMRITPRFHEAIQIIPLTSLFLETDGSMIKITEIYQEVSQILNLPLEGLKNQIKMNFETLFFDIKDCK